MIFMYSFWLTVRTLTRMLAQNVPLLCHCSPSKFFRLKFQNGLPAFADRALYTYPHTYFIWSNIAFHHIVFHYGNFPMQYTEIFSAVKIENFTRKVLILLNIDRGCTLEPHRRGGSNEYPPTIYVLDQKIKKRGIPLHTPVLLYKSSDPKLLDPR